MSESSRDYRIHSRNMILTREDALPVVEINTPQQGLNNEIIQNKKKETKTNKKKKRQVNSWTYLLLAFNIGGFVFLAMDAPWLAVLFIPSLLIFWKLEDFTVLAFTLQAILQSGLGSATNLRALNDSVAVFVTVCSGILVFLETDSRHRIG